MKDLRGHDAGDQPAAYLQLFLIAFLLAAAALAAPPSDVPLPPESRRGYTDQIYEDSEWREPEEEEDPWRAGVTIEAGPVDGQRFGQDSRPLYDRGNTRRDGDVSGSEFEQIKPVPLFRFRF